MINNLRIKFSIRSSKVILILFGAPGVGKGTYAKLIRNEFKFNHISAGDQIRKLLKPRHPMQTNESLDNIRNIVKSGGLVNDELVFQMIKNKMNEPQSQIGVILDGFPRTTKQLTLLEKQFPIHCVLNITLRDDILLRKLLGRRTCSGCGQGYNLCGIQQDGYLMQAILPKKEGLCDVCDTKLLVREDDNEQVITKRMIQYNQKTKPLLIEFEKKGVLKSFQVKHGVKDYPHMKQLIIQTLYK